MRSGVGGNPGSDFIGSEMLNLSRYPGQKIVVTHEPTGDQLVIEVHEVNRDKAVQLRLQANRCFLIDREEIHEDKKMRGSR